jgi:hypothetical protein
VATKISAEDQAILDEFSPKATSSISPQDQAILDEFKINNIGVQTADEFRAGQRRSAQFGSIRRDDSVRNIPELITARPDDLGGLDNKILIASQQILSLSPQAVADTVLNNVEGSKVVELNGQRFLEMPNRS